MERKGAINCYGPRHPDLRGFVYTINLAAGVTPFIRFFENREHHSLCYNLRIGGHAQPLVVTHGNYRPTPDGFKVLDEWSQEHVLNGGLLLAELGKAAELQIPDDPTTHEVKYEAFQKWSLKVYGVRRPAGADQPPTGGR